MPVLTIGTYGDDGTTMTAWLAAFNGSAEARQTALAHTLFNVAGTILLIPFFVPAILPLATSFFPNYADAVTTNGVTTYPHMAAPMAAVQAIRIRRCAFSPNLTS